MVIFHSYVSLPEGKPTKILASNMLVISFCNSCATDRAFSAEAWQPKVSCWFLKGKLMKRRWLTGGYFIYIYMGFHSINGVIPHWMVYDGKSHTNGWFKGTPILGTLHTYSWMGEIKPTYDILCPCPFLREQRGETWENIGKACRKTWNHLEITRPNRNKDGNMWNKNKDIAKHMVWTHWKHETNQVDNTQSSQATGS